MSAEDIMNAQFLEQAHEYIRTSMTHEPSAAPYVTPDEVARYAGLVPECITPELLAYLLDEVVTYDSGPRVAATLRRHIEALEAELERAKGRTHDAT